MWIKYEIFLQGVDVVSDVLLKDMSVIKYVKDLRLVMFVWGEGCNVQLWIICPTKRMLGVYMLNMNYFCRVLMWYPTCCSRICLSLSMWKTWDLWCLSGGRSAMTKPLYRRWGIIKLMALSMIGECFSSFTKWTSAGDFGMVWSFSCNSFLNSMVKQFGRHNMTLLYPILCSIEAYFKGTAKYSWHYKFHSMTGVYEHVNAAKNLISLCMHIVW